eukprot:UN07510
MALPFFNDDFQLKKKVNLLLESNDYVFTSYNLFYLIPISSDNIAFIVFLGDLFMAFASGMTIKFFRYSLKMNVIFSYCCKCDNCYNLYYNGVCNGRSTITIKNFWVVL